MSHRIRITQAAALKQRVADELGEVAVADGQRVTAFPAPARVLDLPPIRGLTERKLAYLRAVGQAAEEGVLDAERLRGLDRDEALAQLRELPGVGPFGADLILLRGAGDPDGVPGNEPRLAQAVAAHYGPDRDPEQVAEGWRPYRTWVSLLLRVDLERSSAVSPL